jgi:RES domain-containing protein
VVEAYRHLVDDIEGMSPERVRGRVLLTAQIHANEVIDLTTAASRLSVGLSEEDLVTDVGDYEKCNRIGHVAHQLACHGILVPAATGLGETLALFVDFLTVAELPTRVGEPVKWMTLPRDPRRLRVVREDQAHPPA